MLRFLLTRVSLVIPTFIGVTLLTFTLIRLAPGDPVLLMAGERGMDPVRYAAARAELHLDEPILVQYGYYMASVLRGDLGRSVVTREPVLSEFFALFPATIELSFFAALFALLIGVPAGIVAAVKRGSIFDHSLMVVSLTGYSMPIFWWGILAVMLFSVTLGWTPVSGRISVMFYFDTPTGFMLIDAWLSGDRKAFWSAVNYLVLPAIVLGTVPLAIFARMTRSSMLEVLGDDYIRTARAKGLRPAWIVSVHALRNALIPVVTVIGLQVGGLLTGAILTETVFSWPGVGKWLIESIRRRDYPVLQGGVLLVASIVMLVNLLVDVMYGLINPRIRHSR
jgi:dipeptide transport system permease protein